MSRLASTTKEYADAALDVGARLNVPVVNLWKAFMAKTEFTAGTWKLGDSLPGSLDVPQNDALVELMYDGTCLHATNIIGLDANRIYRAPLQSGRL